MLGVVIKFALAGFALIVAILAVSDLKTISEDNEQSKPWWKRLTFWGRLKLLCATGTFLLLGLNEYLNHKASADASDKAAKQSEELRAQLSSADQRIGQSRDALGGAILRIDELGRRNDYLIRSLDGSLKRAGIIRVSSSHIERSSVPLRFEGGDEVRPKRHDIFEWSFACAGPLPPLPTPQQSYCAALGYGRLFANGYPIDLRDKSGKDIYYGTRSTDGVMEYRSAAEDANCRRIPTEMKQAMCELHISVMREARWDFENMEATKSTTAPAVQATQDACRRYEALYNESCEEALRRMSPTR